MAPKEQQIVEALREGPLKIHDWPKFGINRDSLSVHIHRLREAGYGIRLVKAYELMYEPEDFNDKA